ncbi:MAG: response regulator [bacterium]|nr:response regulator [bacterium]
MNDHKKSKADLLSELRVLRKRNEELETLLRERPQAEEVPRDNVERKLEREKYDILIENVDAGLNLIGMDGTVLFLNRAAALLWGGEPREIINKNLRDVFPPGKFLDECFFIIDKIKEKGEGVEQERYAAHLNKWYIENVQPVKNEMGEIHALQVLTYDITRRKRAEEALSMGKNRATALLEAIPDMVFRMDTDGVFLDYKAEKSDLHAQVEGTIIGKKNRDISQPDFADLFERKIKQTLESGEMETFEYQLSVPAGEMADFEARMVKSGDSEVTAFVRNVTERRKAEQKLRSSEALMRKMAENYPNSYISVIENDYSVGFTAGREFKKLGLDPQQFIGLTLEQVFGDNTDFIREHYKKTFEGEEGSFELNVNNQHQLYRTVPLYSEDGSIQRILTVVENITSRKRMEESLVALKEKAEAASLLKSRFLANMSHDIRTPLNAVIGFTDLLSKKEQRKDAGNYLDNIKNAGKGLLNIVDDILDFSKIESGQLDIYQRTFRVKDMIADIVNIFELQFREKNIQLETRISPGTPEAVCNDKWRVNQVLTNLLSNARKFTDKGKVVLAVGYREAGLDTANPANPGSMRDALVIRVKDTGIGIPPQHLEQIFVPFIQLDDMPGVTERGTGLGLAICSRLVQLMGGSISVSAPPGEGSEFIVEIPANSDKIEELPRTESPTESLDTTPDEKKGSKILIAEDSPVNMELLKEQLNKAGFHDLLSAWNGKEAVESALEHSPDMILMDIRMPVMDGNEAIVRLRKEGYKGAIIALSAYAQREDINGSLELGATDYITKPINFDAFFERLAKHLGKKEILRPASGPVEKERRLPASRKYKIRESVSQQVKDVFLQDVESKIGILANILKDGRLADTKQEMRILAHNYRGNAEYFGLPELTTVAAALGKGIRAELPEHEITSLTDTLIELLNGILKQNASLDVKRDKKLNVNPDVTQDKIQNVTQDET